MQVTVLNLSPKDEAITGAAESIYRELQVNGIDVLLDDRDERPGSKFKDADLIGIPYRVTVGKGFTQNGTVEIRQRATGETITVPFNEAASKLVETIAAELAER